MTSFRAITRTEDWLKSYPITECFSTVEQCEEAVKKLPIFGTHIPIWIENTTTLKSSPQGYAYYPKEKFIQGELNEKTFNEAWRNRTELIGRERLTKSEDEKLLKIMYETSKSERWNPNKSK